MSIANERREEERRGVYYTIDYYVTLDRRKSSSHNDQGHLSRCRFIILKLFFLSFMFTNFLFGGEK